MAEKQSNLPADNPLPASAPAQQRQLPVILGPLIIVVILAVFWLPQLLNNAAAKVNGESISRDQLKQRVAFERLWNEWNGSTVATSGPDATQFQAQVLNTMIENRLVMQEAKKVVITASTQEVADQVAGMEAQLQISDAQVNADLSKAGLSRQTLQSILRDDVIVNKYLSTVVLKDVAQADQSTTALNWYNAALAKANVQKYIETTAVKVGQPAPDFTLNGLDGKPLRLSDFKGKPVFINFFATWCDPCRSEMADLESAWKANKDNGLVILEVNLTDQDTVSDVNSFVSEFKLSMPVVLDEKGTVSSLYRVGPIPSSYFINKNGVLSAVQVGAMSPTVMNQRLAKILP